MKKYVQMFICVAAVLIATSGAMALRIGPEAGGGGYTPSDATTTAKGLVSLDSLFFSVVDGHVSFNTTKTWWETYADGVKLWLGTAGNAGLAWEVADGPQKIANALNLYDASGNFFLAFDPTNHRVVSAATASPEFAVYDSDAATGDTNLVDKMADYYAGGIGGNLTTTTEGAKIGDLYFYGFPSTAAGTKTILGKFNGANNYWDYGARQVKAYDELEMVVIDFATDVTTGDGKFYIHIGRKHAGMNLTYCHAQVVTAGATGTTDIQIANVTDSQDILSTKLTIDSAETGSHTAATAAVINTTYDDVAENDLLRIDVDAVSTTKPKGLIVTLGFNLP